MEQLTADWESLGSLKWLAGLLLILWLVIMVYLGYRVYKDINE